MSDEIVAFVNGSFAVLTERNTGRKDIRDYVACTQKKRSHFSEGRVHAALGVLL